MHELYHDVTDYSTVYHLTVVPDKYSLQITTDFNKDSIITKQQLIRVSFFSDLFKGPLLSGGPLPSVFNRRENC